MPTFYWYARLKKTVSVKERQMSHTLAKRYEGISGFEMYFLGKNEINDTLGFTSCWQSRVCRRRCQASRFIFVAPSGRARRQYQHCVVFLVSGFTLICVASPRRGVCDTTPSAPATTTARHGYLVGLHRSPQVLHPFVPLG